MNNLIQLPRGFLVGLDQPGENAAFIGHLKHDRLALGRGSRTVAPKIDGFQCNTRLIPLGERKRREVKYVPSAQGRRRLLPRRDLLDDFDGLFNLAILDRKSVV